MRREGSAVVAAVSMAVLAALSMLPASGTAWADEGVEAGEPLSLTAGIPLGVSQRGCAAGSSSYVGAVPPTETFFVTPRNESRLAPVSPCERRPQQLTSWGGESHEKSMK